MRNNNLRASLRISRSLDRVCPALGGFSVDSVCVEYWPPSNECIYQGFPFNILFWMVLKVTPWSQLEGLTRPDLLCSTPRRFIWLVGCEGRVSFSQCLRAVHNKLARRIHTGRQTDGRTDRQTHGHSYPLPAGTGSAEPWNSDV